MLPIIIYSTIVMFNVIGPFLIQIDLKYSVTWNFNPTEFIYYLDATFVFICFWRFNLYKYVG